MANNQRHRTSVSVSSRGNPRPISRASTTSAHSHPQDTQPLQFDSKPAQASYTFDDASAAVLQHLGGGLQAGQTLDGDLHHGPQIAPVFVALQNGESMRHQSPYMQSAEFNTNAPGSVASGAEVDDRRKKGSAASATNDKELRELLTKNDRRSLKDVAQEVIQKERTPQAEKTKQLFAMLWSAKTSVPRNRVYSHYATRCGTERVIPLNPASFGKLVRVIFPGIQTRRLGVRGESKYHYVDLCLEEDQPEDQQHGWRPGSNGMDRPDMRRSASTSTHIDFNTMPRLPADTAVFPTQGTTFEIPDLPPPVTSGPASHGKLFAYPDVPGIPPDGFEASMYEHSLRFPSTDETPFRENDPIALPDIHRYCPPKTDVDVVEALTALYRTHCTSLIDCIRFCKEKQFFRLFTSFHGTLTVPVQKLLAHPSIAPWIQECDWLMYQKMVRFVSRLTLQAAPPVVITILNNISSGLHAHIQKTFQSSPAHVLEAKLKPATIFAGLLHRLIRVNAAAHAAANLLTSDQNREQMWREWITMVNAKRVIEAELPNCGYEEVYKILTQEIRALLEPLSLPNWTDNTSFSFDTPYNYQGQANNSFSQSFQQKPRQSYGVSTENVLDRWSAFLSALPGRFPNASARTLIHCISGVGTAALRDITIMGGASYQTWWVTKIFVDEMALWLAALGGFLEHKPSDEQAKNASPVITPQLEQMSSAGMPSRSTSASHMHNFSGDYPPMNGHSQAFGQYGQSQIQAITQQTVPLQMQLSNSRTRNNITSAHGYQTPFPPPVQQQQHPQQHTYRLQTNHNHSRTQTPHENNIDDSGIGMDLIGDDYAAEKFAMPGLHIGTEIMSGDPGALQ
ncbi:hypothetical protein LTR50_006672 [Elasticomyces elasticus]|nr:hypothetical protein LTR50_006672 [Elasticomyces elasticus]